MIEADFKYLTPKIRLDENSLNESQLFSKAFHMVCSSERCRELVSGIHRRREEIIKAQGLNASIIKGPLFVWEPVPDQCTPEATPMLFQALRYVDVVSPNEHEFGRFFGNSTWNMKNAEDIAIAEKLVGSGIGPEGKGMLVVRCGKDGCCVFTRGRSSAFPAVKGVNVIDPTGAGNSFLGALAQGLATPSRYPIASIASAIKESNNWYDIVAAWKDNLEIPATLICATVAASFVIEQVGTPAISWAQEKEIWNGQSYTERVDLYLKSRNPPVDA